MAYRVDRDRSGNWILGFGDEFPTLTVEGGIPIGSRFLRTDLLRAYLWDGIQWSEEPGSGGGPGGSLTVLEDDTLPTVANVTKIRLDQSDGLVLTDLGSGEVRFDLEAIPQARIAGLVADLAAVTATANAAAITAEDALFLALTGFGARGSL